MTSRNSWLIRSDVFTREVALSEGLAKALAQRFALVNHLRTSPRIVIATDWSESHGFFSDGILVADYMDFMHWCRTDLAHWRATERFPDSISYKKITSGDERDLLRLNRFLRCANFLPGILITGSVPRNPKRIFANKEDCREGPNSELRGRLGDKSFEKLRRFGTFLSVTLKPIRRPGQEIIWLSDPDEIIANESIRITAQRYLAGHLSAVTGVDTLLAAITPPDLDNEIAGEDILAIPDIAAGAMGEYIETCLKFHGSHGIDADLTLPPMTRDKATEVALWFGLQQTSLAKVALSLNPDESQAILHVVHNEPRPH